MFQHHLSSVAAGVDILGVSLAGAGKEAVPGVFEDKPQGIGVVDGADHNLVAGLEDAAEFFEGSGWVKEMFDGVQVENQVEGVGFEGEVVEVAVDVGAAVVAVGIGSSRSFDVRADDLIVFGERGGDVADTTGGVEDAGTFGEGGDETANLIVFGLVVDGLRELVGPDQVFKVVWLWHRERVAGKIGNRQ